MTAVLYHRSGMAPWTLAFALAALAAAPAATRLRVPEGFVIEAAAGKPETVFPMFAAFDDRGRLYVAESSGLDLYAELTALTRRCRVRLLEDRDGDGAFEASRVFAEGLVFPMGLVWRKGELYVADPPEIVALADQDGDGRADRRRTVLKEFGHTDNGSLHGLAFGPDGLLYSTMGSPDGYRLRQADGSMLTGDSGALIRVRPDGEIPEVLSRGFVNLIEVVFLPSGEVIATDNWFQLPSEGMRDALVHLVEGGLYPRQEDTGTAFPLTGEPLPAVSLFPAVALSGLCLEQGPSFPTELRGSLFSAQHNTRKVARHALERAGSTFRSSESDFVWTDDPDFHPSDVLQDANGDLLVVDTGGWYVQHCPTGKILHSMAPGGIYRVRRPDGPRPADAWASEVDWSRADIPTLVSFLADARPAAREKAREELIDRGEAAVPALAGFLAGGAGLAAKAEAVWALARIPAAACGEPLRKALRAADPDLAALAARALAHRSNSALSHRSSSAPARRREPSIEDRAAASDLAEVLAAGTPAVRLAAAEALARLGGPGEVPALWKALEAELDRHLEHAVIHALHRLVSKEEAAAALESSSARVQRAALILLDQPPRNALTVDAAFTRLSSADAGLRAAALAAIRKHRDWSARAAGEVRRVLDARDLAGGEEVALRQLALGFAADPAVAAVVGPALSRDPPLAAARAAVLLEAMAEAHPAEVPRAWLPALEAVLRGRDRALRALAVRATAVLRLAELDRDMLAIASGQDEPPDLRLEALHAAAGRLKELPGPLFEFLLRQLDAEASPLNRLRAAEALARLALDEKQLAAMLDAVRGQPLISPSLLLPLLERAAGPESAALAAGYLEDSVRAGWNPRADDLKRVLERLRKSGRDQALLELLKESGGDERARLAELQPLLSGGDAARGREVFRGKKAACAGCHRAGGEGGRVGPDLTRIGAVRAGKDLLESIVFPSSTFAQGYETYVVATRGGQVETGVLAERSAVSVLLRNASGAERSFRQSEIQLLDRQPVSLMPQGLDRLLSREELRDLLAYLGSLKSLSQ